MYAERYRYTPPPQHIAWIASTSSTLLSSLISTSLSHHSSSTPPSPQPLALILTLTFLTPLGPTTRISALRAPNTLASIEAVWGPAMVDKVLLWTLATAAFATTDPRAVEKGLHGAQKVVFRTGCGRLEGAAALAEAVAGFAQGGEG